MALPEGWQARITRLRNRVAARQAARARPATAFTSAPEPRSVGYFARGRQLAAGNLLFAGHLLEAPGAMVWDLAMPDALFEEELHGFAWLDDLAAVGEASTREVAQAWVWGWIDRFGKGTGPGWTPELTGRRLIRCIHHAIFLLRGQEKDASDAFFRSLGQQAIFLGKRWDSAAVGLPLFEALCGLIYAGLSLKGMEDLTRPALAALERECARRVDAGGGIATRNPEELLEVFTLLIWVAAAQEDAGGKPGPELSAAIRRIAPTLRALRHADGGLARFHGGGRGLDGWLDQSLAASGVRQRPSAGGLAMGFARLSAGRTSLIVDAAPPPQGPVSMNAHASTLAFELTSGRRPLVVSCGAGAIFGEDWRRAGRATPSHSTLCLDGYSSARLGQTARRGATERETLEDTPRNVPFAASSGPKGARIELGHDGYVTTHGLTHARVLELAPDGRDLAGEDLLLALEDSDKRRFDRRMDELTLAGITYAIRFHLHPEVDAEIDMGGTAVSLVLRSGEVWVFRFNGKADLSLEPSVYLERRRLRPRATKQIVLTGRAMEYATRVRWSLAKAQETAIAIRDLVRDEADLTR